MLGASLGMWFTSQEEGIFNCTAVKISKHTKMEIKYKFLMKNKNLDCIMPT